MTTTFAIVSTKGGVGKTTEAANLGGICAEFGMRTLLVDGDVQPSLSKYYPLFYRAPCGLTAVITRGGSISEDCVSKTSIPNLDIIVSDAPDGALQSWLKDREDRLVILKRAIRSSFVRDNYGSRFDAIQHKMYEISKYVSYTNHMCDGFWMVANKKAFESLPASTRDIVVKVMNEAAVKQRTDVERLNGELATNLGAKGVQFTRVDRAPFQEKLRQAGFYKEWKRRMGDEAWSLLEATTGKLA